MTILVTGGTGQLGTAFRRVLPEAIFPPRPSLDLSRPDGLTQTLGSLPTLSAIVNCGAYTQVDRAEDEEDLAHLVNGESVGVLAQYAAGAGIPFLTFSTDYVFDGETETGWTEEDEPAPINAYGRSKLHGETLALGYPTSLVVRTSWVMSSTHESFLTAILKRTARGEEVRVVDDQRGRPTVAKDLAEWSWRAMGLGATGLLHLANSGSTTWFEVARLAVDVAGHEPSLVHPCGSDEYPTKATRPKNSTLLTHKSEALGLDPMPAWESAIAAAVRGLGRLG